MKTFLQIFAIARSEFRFALRRGAPVAVTVVVGLAIGVALLLEPLLNLDGYIMLWEEFSPEQIDAFTDMGITREIFYSLQLDSFADETASSTTRSWHLFFMVLLLLPMATAGTIPADRQFGVLELLLSMPMKGSTYLIGKMAGVAAVVTFIAFFPFLLFLAVLEGVFLTTFHTGIHACLAGFFLKLTLMDGWPILAFACLIGILVGIPFRSRRAAIFPGFIAGIASLFAWTKLLSPPVEIPQSMDVAAAYVFQGYKSIAGTSWAKFFPQEASISDYDLLGMDVPHIGFERVMLMYLALLLTLFLLTILARLWLQRKENF